MRKMIICAVLFFIFCVPVRGAVFALTKTDPATSFSWPEISANAAVVLDGNTGRVLYEKNAERKEYMASTTKIMTCLLALETIKNKKEKVRISEIAANQEGSSIYMEAGEKISTEDLLYALMLRSGNDAAVALAERIASSEEQFAALMNQRAKALGAVNTHFVTASGLHDEDHYTTAKDLGLIAYEAMKNQDFQRIVGTKAWNATRAVDKMNYFSNKNKVLYQYEGGNGIKIGYTQAAGRCLVASSERNGVRLICVVLSANDWFNDSYQLMDTVYEHYEAVQIAGEGIPLKTIGVEKGTKDKTKLIPRGDVSIPLTEEERESIQIQYQVNDSVPAPIARGDVLGTMSIYLKNQKVGVIDLIAREDIELKRSQKLSFPFSFCLNSTETSHQMERK